MFIATEYAALNGLTRNWNLKWGINVLILVLTQSPRHNFP